MEIIRETIRDEKDKPKIKCEGCEAQYPSDFITDDGVHLCKYCFVSLLEEEIGQLRQALKRIQERAQRVLEGEKWDLAGYCEEIISGISGLW